MGTKPYQFKGGFFRFSVDQDEVRLDMAIPTILPLPVERMVNHVFR
jgi:hypothetical protein